MEKITVIRAEHFNAAHRLHNDNWSDEKNKAFFGKCNNPNYHGHNYDLEVMVSGHVDPESGYLIDMKVLSDLIKSEILDCFDHKNLNLDTVEFKNLNPTAENIAVVIYDKLRLKLDQKLNYMKLKEISSSTLVDEPNVEAYNFDLVGDDHISTSYDTPIRSDAFDISDKEKKNIIERHFRAIMETLGLDLTDDSLSGTPHRVAKMYIDEIFYGLNPKNKPKVALFENKYKYNEMLVERNITFYSNCEHHFVPIYGNVHVAYNSSGKVIGLSKIIRIVDYFARRPQVQERLTNQIGNELMNILETEDVAVIIDAKHLCVSSRGIKDDSSATTTCFYNGQFQDEYTKAEFHKYLD